MGQNEDLRESRARADEESRRSIVSLSEQSTSTSTGHKLSQSSLIGIELNQHQAVDSDGTERSTESPEQRHLGLVSQQREPRDEERAATEANGHDIRQQSGVRRLLN